MPLNSPDFPASGRACMIDNFSIGLTHGLMLLVAWRLMFRADIDDDNASETPVKPKRWGKEPPADA
jgi:hypothetical protein